MITINMKNLGLTEILIRESQKYKDLYVGRVSAQSKDLYKVITVSGELTASISGKFHYTIKSLVGYPAVGDFVMLDRMEDSRGKAIIHHVLPRRSAFIRKVAGNTKDTQIVASNIDTVFICMSLNNDFNLRRLERYLSIAFDSGATPVVVLTKSDLCKDVKEKLSLISSIAIGVDILVTTSISNNGYGAVQDYISIGKTVAFIGSSGVGKSTLINLLLDKDVLNTQGIRNDDKGRHTTTRRELFVIPQGGAVIDTPGMREIGIIQADLGQSFADIEELADDCKFADCTHSSEPNCAVQKAIREGVLSTERLGSYNKLKIEASYDGLDARLIEKEKINRMFDDMGGMKNGRKYLKEQNRKKSR